MTSFYCKILKQKATNLSYVRTVPTGFERTPRSGWWEILEEVWKRLDSAPELPLPEGFRFRLIDDKERLKWLIPSANVSNALSLPIQRRIIAN